MNVVTQRIVEAGSFVPFDLRQIASTEKHDSAIGDGDPGHGVLLSCDISGFSGHSNTFFSQGEGGVDAFHQLLDQHFRDLLDMVVARGGKPLFFFGDALLSIWSGSGPDDRHAAQNAIAAALEISERRRSGLLPFDLNLHVAAGSFQLLEVGGNNDQWHLAAIGAAMTALQRIGGLRAPNQVIASAEAVAAAGPGLTIAANDLDAAEIVSATPCIRAAPLAIPEPPESALPYFLSRSPKSVRRWLSTLGLQWVAEQRPVTAVLTTLTDFDQSAPDAADRLRTVVRRIQECVQAHDGAIDNVMIDDKGAAVLSIFGVPPDAHSDDPARGVVSAMDIHAALEEVGELSSSAVSSGQAFCALVGNRNLRSYMVVGDVVTRASRISAAMQQNEAIRVDAATMRSTDSLIGYREGPRNFVLKGIEGPTPAWPVPPRDQWTVQDRGFSGRELELGLLRTLWGRVRSGNGSAGAIVEGEAGSGKTTLALVLRDTVVGHGGLFMVSEALRVRREVPFAGMRQVIVAALGLTDTMSVETRRKILAERLPQDVYPHAPLIEALVPCGLEESPATARLTGRARAEALENLLCAIILRAFGDTRACLCFEDARWLDPNSSQLLDRLVREAPNLMVLILRQTGDNLLDRPEDLHPDWEVVTLGPLDRAGLDALVRSTLGATEIDPDLITRIAAVSGGQPFFAAEVLQGLIDADAIQIDGPRATLDPSVEEATLPLPRSIHGAVLQRLDRLEPDSQLTLRAASVAGPTFSLGLAVDIHPLVLDEAVAIGHFTDHVHRGFLDAHMFGAKQGYSFRHGIVRDVAYNQVPAAMRKTLHGKVASWLEAQGQYDTAGGLSELAHHWAEAGEIGKAISYLAQEAARIFGQGFANNAVSVGFQAVRLAGIDVPEDEAAYLAATGENMGAIAALIGDRAPTDLAQLRAIPDEEAQRQLETLVTLCPFAFQSNRFDIYAWAASTSVGLLLSRQSGNAQAFSLHSVVVAALTGDRALGAEWSRAALLLDEATGGHSLAPVGFVDAWFHSHWRAPLLQSSETIRRAAARGLATGDAQYSSYNIAGEVVISAAMGRRLVDILQLGDRALQHSLIRNAEVQVLLEMQCARALRGETFGPTSLSSAEVDEVDKIAWVLSTEFANQIGYYLATQVRLRRHAGDWAGAVAAAEQSIAVAPAIAGQTAEIDILFHSALARISLLNASDAEVGDHHQRVARALETFSLWAELQPENFAHKANILKIALAGLKTDRLVNAGKLAAQSHSLGLSGQWQDRALASEYAARLDPRPERIAAAAAAYRDWGARAVADRLLIDLG